MTTENSMRAKDCRVLLLVAATAHFVAFFASYLFWGELEPYYTSAGGLRVLRRVFGLAMGAWMVFLPCALAEWPLLWAYGKFSAKTTRRWLPTAGLMLAAGALLACLLFCQGGPWLDNVLASGFVGLLFGGTSALLLARHRRFPESRHWRTLGMAEVVCICCSVGHYIITEHAF